MEVANDAFRLPAGEPTRLYWRCLGERNRLICRRTQAGCQAETAADVSVNVCAYSRVLEIISSKWVVLIMRVLEDGSKRYGEIARRIEGVSQKMLTQTLRQLERDGLVHRNVYPTVPVTVEYTLTPRGESLMQHIRGFKEWTNAYWPLVERARKEYDSKKEHVPDGTGTSPPGRSASS